MFTITHHQLNVFETDSRARFEFEMVQHLRKFNPPLSAFLGQKRLEKLVQFGLQRAKRHRFTKRAPLRFYLEMICFFGGYFDTDPLLPWAAKILDDRTRSEMDRADRLYDQAMEFVRTTSGDHFELEIAALERAVEESTQVPRPTEPDFQSEMIRRMRKVYPERAKRIGSELLEKAIPLGHRAARRYQVTSPFGVAFFVGLVFAMGHRFHEDPRTPWVHDALTDSSISDPNERVVVLHQQITNLWKGFLANRTNDAGTQ